MRGVIRSLGKLGAMEAHTLDIVKGLKFYFTCPEVLISNREAI
jgi:hypothetical protein